MNSKQPETGSRKFSALPMILLAVAALAGAALFLLRPASDAPKGNLTGSAVGGLRGSAVQPPARGQQDQAEHRLADVPGHGSDDGARRRRPQAGRPGHVSARVARAELRRLTRALYRFSISCRRN